MKYKLMLDKPINFVLDKEWKVEKVLLTGETLAKFLSQTLPLVMEGILDPDISGMSPKGYISNLRSGRLGDFTNRYIICAKDNEKIIGLLIGLPKGEDLVHIYSLGVISSYRRQNVATSLIGYCLRNYKKITLDVHSDNRPALEFYKKLGFLRKTQ